MRNNLSWVYRCKHATPRKCRHILCQLQDNKTCRNLRLFTVQKLWTKFTITCSHANTVYICVINVNVCTTFCSYSWCKFIRSYFFNWYRGEAMTTRTGSNRRHSSLLVSHETIVVDKHSISPHWIVYFGILAADEVVPSWCAWVQHSTPLHFAKYNFDLYFWANSSCFKQRVIIS